jgi:hypothetical protein
VDCIKNKIDNTIYIDCSPFFQNTNKKLDDWLLNITNKKLIKELFIATKKNTYAFFNKKKYMHFLLVIYISNWISPILSLQISMFNFKVSSNLHITKKKEIQFNKLKILEKCIDLFKTDSVKFDDIEKISKIIL